MTDTHENAREQRYADAIVRHFNPSPHGGPWRLAYADAARDVMALADEELAEAWKWARWCEKTRTETQDILARVLALHTYHPADSPFHNLGRAICGTCMDGQEPADWPCATVAALTHETDR